MKQPAESPQRRHARIRRLQREGNYPPRAQRRARVHRPRFSTEAHPFRIAGQPNLVGSSFTKRPRLLVIERRRKRSLIAKASRKANR